jgi:integrase/recombinase XerD
MLVHAILTVIAARERHPYTGVQKLIPLTLNEIRRLFAKLISNTIHPISHWLAWSQWRRRHQARARTSTLAPLLQAFFTERLIGQREASSYRDAICLLLRFAKRRTGKTPHQLDLPDLDAPLIGAFLNHLEVERGVSIRTRNARLTAIRSLFGFAAYRHPEHAAVIQRVLAIPPKRTDRALVTYLTEAEMQALLAAPDRSTRIGRRDHVLLLLALETGLRVSELTALTCAAVHLGTGAHVRCHGKGRKERITPLRRQARTLLRAWLTERGGAPSDPLFPLLHG